MGHGQALLWAMASWATGRPCWGRPWATGRPCWGRPWAAGRPCCGLWPHGPQTCARTCMEMFVCICIDMCPDMVSCSMRRSSLSPTARPAARCRFPRLLFFFTHPLLAPWLSRHRGAMALRSLATSPPHLPPQHASTVRVALDLAHCFPLFGPFFFHLLCADGHSAPTVAPTPH